MFLLFLLQSPIKSVQARKTYTQRFSDAEIAWWMTGLPATRRLLATRFRDLRPVWRPAMRPDLYHNIKLFPIFHPLLASTPSRSYHVADT
jgi:hypothetical protein